MRPWKSLRLIALCLATQGCGDTLAGLEGEVTLFARANTVVEGTPIRFSLMNYSGETVGHGTLPCNASWQRLEGDAWVTVRESRVCTLQLLILRNGESTHFNMAAPVPGTYRVTLHGSWEDRRGEYAQSFTVTSHPITVH